MLRPEVVQAVAEGKFHLYTMRTVEEGLELLTGLEAGERKEDGQWPEESVHGKVQARLRDFAESYKEFNVEEGAGDESEE
jgi:RPA family protein